MLFLAYTLTEVVIFPEVVLTSSSSVWQLCSYLEDQEVQVLLEGLVIRRCQEVLEALGIVKLQFLHVSSAAWQHLIASLKEKFKFSWKGVNTRENM